MLVFNSSKRYSAKKIKNKKWSSKYFKMSYKIEFERNLDAVININEDFPFKVFKLKKKKKRETTFNTNHLINV